MDLKLLLILILSLTIITNEYSQQNNSNKGAVPLTTNNQQLTTAKTTRAVIVGISDYQSPEIPDLKYADKDAIAFAAWLKSPAGGSVDSANIQLLVNQGATQGKFGAALDWLRESSGEGDQAIIYFSGHGDIEVKTRYQPGFLLCWDAPPKVYSAGGAFGLFYLQDIISTISIDKKSRVLVITDACHAGKLAGTGIGGGQATAEALKQQYANEAKILSCQSNEISMEGIQWGGGRGVFSYYLLDGLIGLADQNDDRKITLSEIENYLEKKVGSDTKPNIQTPITVGDKQLTVSNIDPESLSQLIKSKNELLNSEFLTSKGPIDDYLNFADTTIKRIYKEFEISLKQGSLLDNNETQKSANDLYISMLDLDPGNPLINIMRRNLAATLQDEVQQALNAVLDDNPYEVNNWRYNKGKYKNFTRYLERIVELLGTKHYLYKSLIAKKLFFEAFNMVHYSGTGYVPYSDSMKLEARKKLYQALVYDETAFIYYLLGNSFIYDLKSDSIEAYFGKAMQLAPNWKLPYSEISWYYLDVISQYKKADDWLTKGLSIDSNSYNLLEMYAWLQQRLGNVELIKSLCSRMRKLHPELYTDYVTLAYTYGHVKRDFKLAELNILNALKLKKGFIQDYPEWILGYIFFNTRRIGKAKMEWNHSSYGGPYSAMIGELYSGMIWLLNERKDSLIDMNHRLMDSKLINVLQGGNYDLLVYRGLINILLHKYDSAEYFLKIASNIEFNSSHMPHVRGLAYLALLYKTQGRIQEAEQTFKKAIVDHTELNSYQGKVYFNEAFFLYGNFLSEHHRYVEAEEQYQTINKNDYGCVFGFYGMATLRARQGKDKEALDWLEKALDWYFPRPEPIYNEPAFENIRKTKRFKAMMEKNFPLRWEN